MPIRQQRGREIITSGIKAAGERPGSSGWVIKFRACDDSAGAGYSAGNEYFPIGQQRRGVLTPCGVEATGDSPQSCSWVVNLRAGKWRSAIVATRYQDSAIGEQRCGV